MHYKILKCYLDTSVFNFALATAFPDKQDPTLRFLDQCRNEQFEAYISTLVIKEIASTSDQKKKEELLALIRNLKLQEVPLPEDRTNDLVEQYLQAGIIPPKARNDAAHIAAAVLSDLDVVVSWNLEHMVRLAWELMESTS